MTRIKLLAGLIVVVAAAVGISYAVDRRPGARQEIPSPLGTITGRVLDAQGQPVSGAEVRASGESGSIGRVPLAYTDGQGAFTLTRLAPGTYTLSAGKEEDGYPNTGLSVYSAGLVAETRAVLGERQTASGVILYLGPRAGRLTGRILDAATNRPIKETQDKQVIIRRADDPDRFYSTGPDAEGNFSILLPAAPFTLEVSAPGYETWQYTSKDVGKRPPLTPPAPGETKRLTVALRPTR